MQFFKYYKSSILVLTLFALALGSCGGSDGEPDPQEEQLQMLAAATWGDQDAATGSTEPAPPGTVVVDGQDVSANFLGFSLSFDANRYNTTGAEDLFSATGTWEWVDRNASQLMLDDGKVVTILELTEELFVFSFFFEDTGGVVNGSDGISGSYTITLRR